MNWRIRHGLRGGAAALGVSAGLMILASTTQTPDGFVHASFGGPLDAFGASSGDVLSIGDGPADATELAALLQTPVKGTKNQPDTPFRVAFEAGSTPDTTALNVFGWRTSQRSAHHQAVAGPGHQAGRRHGRLRGVGEL